MRRRKDKIDENQKQIVAQLRSIPGVSVETGHDDILVGHKKKNYWFEIKPPKARSKKTREILDSFKKKSQIALEISWRGHYQIVTSLDEILIVLKLKREYLPVKNVGSQGRKLR